MRVHKFDIISRMSTKNYRFKLIKAEEKPILLACLVAGYTGVFKDYTKAVKSLRDSGYDVILFEFDNEVLDGGNPALLPNLIRDITEVVTEEAQNYESVLCAGVSLGAFIAFNVQRNIPKAKVGVYGTAGMSVAHAILTARFFRSIKKRYLANGFNEQDLKDQWADIEILDDAKLDESQSMLIVMGKQDRLVRFNKASKAMDKWKANGSRVDYFGKLGLGHATTIYWYKNNLDKLLSRVQEI